MLHFATFRPLQLAFSLSLPKPYPRSYTGGNKSKPPPGLKTTFIHPIVFLITFFRPVDSGVTLTAKNKGGSRTSLSPLLDLLCPVLSLLSAWHPCSLLHHFVSFSDSSRRRPLRFDSGCGQDRFPRCRDLVLRFTVWKPVECLPPFGRFPLSKYFELKALRVKARCLTAAPFNLVQV